MKVIFTKNALKQSKKLPKQVASKLKTWIAMVTSTGLEETRKIPGYHDEPIHKGEGRRSIRLNRQWRAEYTIKKDHNGKFILIIEVHPHDY